MAAFDRLSAFITVQRVRSKAARGGHELRRYKDVADSDGPYFLQDRDTNKIVLDRVPLERVDTWLGDDYPFHSDAGG